MRPRSLDDCIDHEEGCGSRRFDGSIRLDAADEANIPWKLSSWWADLGGNGGFQGFARAKMKKCLL